METIAINIVNSIVQSPDVTAALIFCVAAGFGQVLHAVKKWASGEVESPAAWLTVGLRHTIGALIGNIGGMVVFIQTGVLGPIIAQPNGWWAVFLFGFMNGFTADSALNKSLRTEWTPEQRDAAKAS